MTISETLLKLELANISAQMEIKLIFEKFIDLIMSKKAENLVNTYICTWKIMFLSGKSSQFELSNLISICQTFNDILYENFVCFPEDYDQIFELHKYLAEYSLQHPNIQEKEANIVCSQYYEPKYQQFLTLSNEFCNKAELFVKVDGIKPSKALNSLIKDFQENDDEMNQLSILYQLGNVIINYLFFDTSIFQYYESYPEFAFNTSSNNSTSTNYKDSKIILSIDFEYYKKKLPENFIKD